MNTMPVYFVSHGGGPWPYIDDMRQMLAKSERENTHRDEVNWDDLSLTLAMRGMENDIVPEYTRADLKEIFA